MVGYPPVPSQKVTASKGRTALTMEWLFSRIYADDKRSFRGGKQWVRLSGATYVCGGGVLDVLRA